MPTTAPPSMPSRQEAPPSMPTMAAKAPPNEAAKAPPSIAPPSIAPPRMPEAAPKEPRMAPSAGQTNFSARRRMCHDIMPNTSFYECLDRSFCIPGSLGQTPANASPEYIIACAQGAYGVTRHIQVCRDFTVGKDLVPPRALFASLAEDELRRVCSSCTF